MTRTARADARIDVADALAALGRIRPGTEPLGSVTGTVAELARRCVPAADAASVTLLPPGRSATVACSGRLAAAIDGSRPALCDGPGPAAAVGGEAVRIHDLAGEGRWPEHVAAALRAGIRSSLSVALPVPGSVGTLDLYAATACSFDDATVELVEAFARAAAAALAGAWLPAGAVAPAVPAPQAPLAGPRHGRRALRDLVGLPVAVVGRPGAGRAAHR